VKFCKNEYAQEIKLSPTMVSLSPTMVSSSRRTISKRWRLRAGARRKAAAPDAQKRGLPFVAMKNIVSGTVDAFLGLSSVLALRRCSHAIRKLYCPRAATLLWLRIRPNLNELRCVAHGQTVASAIFFKQLYAGKASSAYTDIIANAALKSGNLGLIQWYATNYLDFDPSQQFRRAVNYGHTEIADWLMSHFRIALDTLLPGPLEAACRAGDVRTARWLIQRGHSQQHPNESSERLLILACEGGYLAIADWIVKELSLVLGVIDFHDLLVGTVSVGAPDMARWAIEALGLTWDDIYGYYAELVDVLRSDKSAETRDASSSVLKWLMDRHCEAWLVRTTQLHADFSHDHLIEPDGTIVCQLQRFAKQSLVISAFE
jgi:hypothetical protein